MLIGRNKKLLVTLVLKNIIYLLQVLIISIVFATITRSLDCMLKMFKIIQNTNYHVILLVLLIVVTGQLYEVA